jgi:peptide/nickel transport system permease protein
MERMRDGRAGFLFATVLILAFLAVALLAPRLTPYDPGGQELSDRFCLPFTRAHPAGCDHLGRDILTRLLYGTRISLLVGVVSASVSAMIGTALGLASGYRGGWVDDLVCWLVNVQLAFPFILLAIAMVAVAGSSLLNVMIILGIASWPAYARIVRSKALTIREEVFVDAARAIGSPDLRILARHILPNVAPSLIVLVSFELAKMVIAEAALSFLGLGPSGFGYSSWGLMLAEGKDYLQVAWWPATFPGLALMVFVLSINLVGDGLRRKLDPRMKL